MVAIIGSVEYPILIGQVFMNVVINTQFWSLWGVCNFSSWFSSWYNWFIIPNV